MTTVLDPTNETAPATIERAMRPESLAGLTGGLLDISKPRGDGFAPFETMGARGADRACA